jgi:transcriptional regulator with XRE-family HTH domain
MDVVPSLDPGSPRVRFGVELRRLREAAQLSQAAVASRLGCTQTQVSRLEKATRTPSRSDAERLDRLFGAPDGVSFTRLHQRIVAQPGGPIWFRSWVEEVEERVQARARRKRILDRDNPPLVLMLIDPGVLHRKVGGAEAMRDQLGYLLKVVQIPTVSIQVVNPDCLTGLMGAFTIAELPYGQPDAIHAESSWEGQVTTDLDSVTAMWNRYEAIRLWAYPEHTSLHMIEKARLEWT